LGVAAHPAARPWRGAVYRGGKIYCGVAFHIIVSWFNRRNGLMTRQIRLIAACVICLAAPA
jgi:hypothetical protein